MNILFQVVGPLEDTANKGKQDCWGKIQKCCLGSYQTPGFFFQQNLSKDPPVQLALDTEGGEDQDNQEEWADALPDLDINPQDLGKGEGGSDTTDSKCNCRTYPGWIENSSPF